MKFIIYTFSFLIIVSCSSVKLPSIEESNQQINDNVNQIYQIDSLIRLKTPNYYSQREMNLGISVDVINTILTKLANQKTEDISVQFLNSQNFITENKSVLGISYTNNLNIEKGQIFLDLKKLNFTKIEGKTISANIELQGNGKISVSGKYLGIPASASPELNFYMNENISFNLTNDKDGSIVFKPNPQKVKLKTKISIKLLEWSLPYNHEIPLELTDLIKPITVPNNLTTELPFPVPAKNFGKDKVEMVNFKVNFKDVMLNLKNNYIEYQSNLEFNKK